MVDFVENSSFAFSVIAFIMLVSEPSKMVTSSLLVSEITAVIKNLTTDLECMRIHQTTWLDRQSWSRVQRKCLGVLYLGVILCAPDLVSLLQYIAIVCLFPTLLLALFVKVVCLCGCL